MKNFAVISISLFLAACAGAPKYTPVTNTEHTTISISSTNDSSSTTGRRLDAAIYKGECEPIGDGVHIGFDIANDSQHSIEPSLIPVGEEILLSVIYQDARFAQNRTCNATVKFAPLTEHKYKGHLYVSEEGLKCALKIDNLTTGTKLKTKTPDYACAYDGVADYKNMQPSVTNWNIYIVN